MLSTLFDKGYTRIYNVKIDIFKDSPNLDVWRFKAFQCILVAFGTHCIYKY